MSDLKNILTNIINKTSQEILNIYNDIIIEIDNIGNRLV